MKVRSRDDQQCGAMHNAARYALPYPLHVTGAASWAACVQMARCCQVGMLVVHEERALLIVCGGCYSRLVESEPREAARVG